MGRLRQWTGRDVDLALREALRRLGGIPIIARYALVGMVLVATFFGSLGVVANVTHPRTAAFALFEGGFIGGLVGGAAGFICGVLAYLARSTARSPKQGDD